MDTWDAIRTRRNVREFDGRPIPPEDIDRIVAASSSP
jgi:nitroreductase